MNREPVRRILVVKMDGFSEFVLAFGAFNAIRRHHANAHITLLTVKRYSELARKSGWFDEVWDEGATAPGRFDKEAGLILRLRRAPLDMVYDLDNSRRTARYRLCMKKLLGKTADWSRSNPGPGPFSQHLLEHYVEQLVRQMANAGITEMPAPNLSWLTTGFAGRFGLQDGYVLIAPGGSLARQGKGWPVERFCELTRRLSIEGRRPVIIGEEADAATNRIIAAASAETMDLTGKTSLFDVAVLATHANAALGNDGGVLRLLAAVGCPTAVMFSAASHQNRNSPRGRYVMILRKENLDDLPVSEVAAALRLR
ncbi:MAG: ADP-heptose--LPS heptosyltransferase [Alphaproteobacteria bacterium]|nr:ADP-heptose--LPS heptosyltransferase [Alphaproteobacteria bacterium]